MYEIPKFYAVYLIRICNEEWTLEAIFTRGDEAEEYKTTLENNDIFVNKSGNIQYLPMEVILQSLTNDALGILAKPINKLAGVIDVL